MGETPVMPVRLAAAARSPFVPVGGELAGWHPVDLAALVMHDACRRAGLDPGDIAEAWVGCAEPVGAQGADLARAAVLAAGWPDDIGGTVVDRAETSGSAALHAAAASLATGPGGAVVVVGVCSGSVVPPGASALARTYGRPWGEAPGQRVEHRGGLLPPAQAADRAAAGAGIDRAAQDEAGERSHRRRGASSAAITAVPARPGEAVAVQKDAPVTADGVRTLPDEPGALPPMFDGDGTVTAMTFAPPADGVTALVLTTGPGGAELMGTGRAAGDPLDPAGGVERAMAASGVDPALVDRWEIAEPTAATLLVVCRRLGLDPAAVNPGGGTLAVGDAGAAEELRLCADGLAVAAPEELVATVVVGTTGSAVTVWRRLASP